MTRAKRTKKDARLMAAFPQQPGQAGTINIKPIWILMKQEMMGWQCHQLDHMQINCTSLQTDNHGSTSLLNFCRLDALSSNSVKALKAIPTRWLYCVECPQYSTRRRSASNIHRSSMLRKNR